MNLADLYGRSPVAVQNIFATGYGVRERIRRYGGRHRALVEELDARQWHDEERIRLDQVSRLRHILAWSSAEVPHYRDEFRRIGFDPAEVTGPEALEALPLLEKEQVRAEPERFRPDRRRDRVVPQTTGGTTGTPLRYWATVDAVRFNYATYEVRSRRWAGVRFGDRLASLHGQPIVPAWVQEPPFWRRNLAFDQLYLSVYHLNDRTLRSYVGALADFQPRVVAGYTSAVHRLARHLIERGDQGLVNPTAVLVSSETLTPAVRHDIEVGFGCRVFDGYSLGELVAYASDCPHGSLHVSPEYGVVEIGPEGAEPGEIVATGLINEAMPLLRYRTGDRAAWAHEPCACGRSLPVLASLEGRVDDVVRTPEGSVIGPAPMSLAFQRVPRLRRAQFHQDDPARARVLLEVAPDFSDDDRAFLDRELRKRLGTSIALDYEVVDQVERTSGGKERLIVSTVGRDAP